MSAIHYKLRDQRGVSIFMGLIFLLVCIVVGTVVLTAATAAAGKLAQMRQNEQNYQTVASAARLLKDRISVLTYTYEVKTVTVDGVIEPGYPETTETLTASDATEEPSVDNKVILEQELKKLCEDLTKKPSEETSAVTEPATDSTEDVGTKFTITAAGPSDLETVYGTLQMDPSTKGRFLVKLWLSDADSEAGGDPTKPGDPKNHNQMELVFDPDGPETNTVVTTQEISVGDATSIEETTTVTTTCSWPEDRCTIRKGTPWTETEESP